MRKTNPFDVIAHSILLLAALAVAAIGVSKVKPKRQPFAPEPSTLEGSSYLALSVSALYVLARTHLLKTKDERRAEHINSLYSRAEHYGSKAGSYSMQAENFLKTHLKRLKSTALK